VSGSISPIRPAKDSAEHEFLLAEYASLTSLANSRDEHADRFLTIYLILAGAPFVIYAALLRERVAKANVLDLPPLVAAALLFVALVGYSILQVVTQLRFSTLLYIRAMNWIRKTYGGEDPVRLGLILPSDPKYPPYNEGPQRIEEAGKKNHRAGKYMYHVVVAMAFVNALYLGLGIYYFPSRLHREEQWLNMLGPTACFAIYWAWQMRYYHQSANQRETRASVPGKL